MQLEKFDRGVILSQRFEDYDIHDNVHYMNHGNLADYPVLIVDGKIILSNSFSHIFQLDILLKNLYTDKLVKKLLFCSNLDLKERIGFHKNEMKMASFLASFGEVPILYAEGKYENDIAKELGVYDECYHSLMVFMPEDLSLLSRKQLETLSRIPEALDQKNITYFEMCTVEETYQSVRFLNYLESRARIVEIEHYLEDTKGKTL